MPTPVRHRETPTPAAPDAPLRARAPAGSSTVDPELQPALIGNEVEDTALHLPDARAKPTPGTKSPQPAPAAKSPQPTPSARPARPAPSAQAPANKPQAPRAQPAPQKKKWLTPASVFALVITVLLYLGWHMPTERYITPKRGIGYALGIIGGSLMLLLFLYSARKRIPWLKFMGPTAGWFRYHMVLGIVGPLCILYHANFGLGATNSNIALFCMLIVAGSGLVGRYIYARIHHGLYGSKLGLGELRKGAENLRAASGAFAFLPELVERLESVERRLLSSSGQVPILGIARLTGAYAISLHARMQLRAYVRKCLRAAAASSTTIAAERKRLRRAAFAYIDRRLAATRRVAGFEAYERLFSLWHALHLPLIFMMLIAGTVHVIAVHVY